MFRVRSTDKARGLIPSWEPQERQLGWEILYHHDDDDDSVDDGNVDDDDDDDDDGAGVIIIIIIIIVIILIIIQVRNLPKIEKGTKKKSKEKEKETGRVLENRLQVCDHHFYAQGDDNDNGGDDDFDADGDDNVFKEDGDDADDH